MHRTASATRYAIQVDGRDLFLFAGDFPYYRLPHRRWPEVLARFRGAQLNAVTISAPWSWHEPEEGEFDLWGQTLLERDLREALALAAENDLFVIFQPGPHVGGWPGGGIPDWLLDSHPEILALDAAGRQVGLDLACSPITYLHPAYQAFVAGWYQAFLPILRRFLVGQQGTVVAVEIDHRPTYGWGLPDGDPLAVDYNPWVVGQVESSRSEGRPGLYQHWLAAHYGSIERLNERYGAQHEAFAEVQPPRRPPASYRELPWFSDWRRCKMDLVNQHLEYLYDWLRGGGVELPIIVLYPYQSPLAARYCADYFRLRGKPVLAAHAPAGGGLGQVVGTTELARRWVKGTALPPASLETPGTLSPGVSPARVELLCALQLGHGLNALGLSPLVGGSLPRDLRRGQKGAGRRGELRPNYTGIRRLGRFLATHGERLLRTEPLADVAFGWYEPYEDWAAQGGGCALGWRDDYRELLWARFGLAHDGQASAEGGGLLDLMATSGLSYAMLDLQRDPPEEWLAYPQLWVLGLDFMAAPVQRELASYVRAGGHLVMLPRVPYLDEHLQPCPLLDELFPTRPISLPGPQPPNRAPLGSGHTRVCVRGKTLSLEGGVEMPVAGQVDLFDLGEGCEALAWAWPNCRPAAYRTRHGRGTATLLGFIPAADGQAGPRRFVNALADQARVRRHAGCDGAALHLVERATPAGSADPAGYLFAVNPWTWPVRARLAYTHPRTGRELHLPHLLEGVELPGQGALILCLEVPIPGTGLTIAYATSQVQGWRVGPGRVTLSLHGPPQTMGELALRVGPEGTAPWAGAAQPERASDEEGELLLFTYPHHQGATILRLQR